MKQREVTDRNNTRWTCVQAYSMLETETAEKASELTEKESGKVTVVCTPSGGAKTVRLELPSNWEDELIDDDLIEEINRSQ